MLSLDDRLYDFFPEYAHLCDSDNKQRITLADMLTMGSGFINNEASLHPVPGEPMALVERALAQPAPHAPGSHFSYYTVGTYLVSVAFSRVEPLGVHRYLRRHLLDPMGFGESHWNIDENGIPMGGYGMFLTSYDLTRLGQLYLQGGQWQGQQLVPADYVKRATSYQIGNDTGGTADWSAGYGYQFWRNSFGGFRADGMKGQYVIVLPEQEAVIVMTAHLSNMQIPLTIIAETLLPAIS